jgi:hypothetical protein
MATVKRKSVKRRSALKATAELPAQRGADHSVPARSASLGEIAARVCIEHRRVIRSAQDLWKHAIKAGQLAIEAKARMKHGERLPWLAANCPDVSERTAQDYMKLARAERAVSEKLESNPKRAADLSIRSALALVSPERSEHEKAVYDSGSPYPRPDDRG